MRNLNFKKSLGLLFFFLISIVHAETQPKFPLIPLGPTKLTVPVNATATVQYRVTNQTKFTRTLTIVPMQGITQIPGGVGNCSTPFVLASKQYCLLNLKVNGNLLPLDGIHAGPVVCKTQGPGDNHPDPFLCTQPSQQHLLDISKGVPQVFIMIAPNMVNLSVGGSSVAITVTNHSTIPAQNVKVEFPAGTDITQDASDCSVIAPNGGTCQIILEPGTTVIDSQMVPVAGSNTNQALLSIAQTTLSGYASYNISGSNGAFTGSMALPGTSPAGITSNSASVSIANGISSWLSLDTPFGAIYGSSQNQQYLNIRSSLNVPTTTEFNFDSAIPSGGGFALGDIDSETIIVAAFDQGGIPLPSTDLGLQGTFNYCDIPSPKPASCAGVTPPYYLPMVISDPNSVTVAGNGIDTVGASVWFMPSAAVRSITFTATAQIGLPIYQVWFAD